MWDWLVSNANWLFSGIGVVTGSAIIVFIWSGRWHPAHWFPQKRIQCVGEAHELRRYNLEHKALSVPKEEQHSYQFHDCILTMYASELVFTGKFIMKRGDKPVAEGTVKSRGPHSHGYAHGIYTIAEIAQRFSWNGLCIFQFSDTTQFDGFFMSNDRRQPGITTFGAIKLKAVKRS
jgi:hypothetical protein